MLKPTFDVDVAEPDTVRPESVVVPKPVDDTDRNEVCVLPPATVEDDIEKMFALVLP